MADAVDRAPDDGRVRLPRVDSAMNKIMPNLPRGGKGGKDDAKDLRLGQEKSEQDKLKLLQRAKKRLDRCIQAESENRKHGLDDLKFLTGEGQWPADVAAARNFDKRPCLTINKLPTFKNQVVNDARQNRPGLHFLPVGDRSDRKVAEMLDGMVRYIWKNSLADTAVDTSFDSGVSIGWGYMRVVTDYESPDSFNQDILIKRVRNTFSVYLDPTHLEPDGSDAKYGFVTEDWEREDFEAEWPDADPMPWTQQGIGDASKGGWNTEKTIRIAEYFEIENEKRTLVQLSNGHVGWEDELDESVQSLIKSGIYKIVNERESDCPKVMWYRLTAVDVLEDQEWLGRWIPLPKFVANEVDIEGKVKLSGLIRNAKQPQLMYNYMSTLAVEYLAGQPKNPWVAAEGQVEGYEDQWDTAHTKNRAVLYYRPISLGGHPVPPPSRQPLPGPSAGITQAIQQAATDMQAVTGIRFDATLNERVYDESGRALRELRRSGDIGAFHYTDNFTRTLRHLGNILMDLIPKVYDTRRIVTILREDDKEQSAVLDPHAAQPYQEERDPKTGKTRPVFNPTIGKYSVLASVGPSYATKRVEAAESMMDFARALPNAAALIMDLIAKNQDWPGAEEMATRLAKAVPPQFLQPEMKDVPPQVQAMLQALDQQVKQLSQERIALMKQLTDQTAERAIKQDKIDKDFEAKLLAVVQKAEASFNQQVGAHLRELGEGVKLLQETLVNPEKPDNG